MVKIWFKFYALCLTLTASNSFLRTYYLVFPHLPNIYHPMVASRVPYSSAANSKGPLPFMRPSATSEPAIVANGNDLDRWCPDEAKSKLRPRCSCIGPRLFPVLRCERMNHEFDFAVLRQLNLPVSNIGKFMLVNSNIKKFEASMFSPALRVKFVHIEKTPMTEFDLKAFSTSRDSLLRLQVVRNEIENFPFGELAEFVNLQYLELYYNAIKTIPDYAFGYNPYIKHIDLSFNAISYVGSFAFYDLPKLEFLDLRFNKLKVVNNYAFAAKFPTTNLVLDLSHNKMFMIAEKAFLRRTLRILAMSSNALRRFDEKHFRPILESMVNMRNANISVDSNLFQCNCVNTRWLLALSESYKKLLHGFTCHNLNDKPLKMVNFHDLKCY